MLKKYSIFEFFIFHIRVSLCSKNSGLPHLYSISEFYSIIEYSIFEFILYFQQHYLPLNLTIVLDMVHAKKGQTNNFIQITTHFVCLNKKTKQQYYERFCKEKNTHKRQSCWEEVNKRPFVILWQPL